ncbi:DUF998 domain-containing protein [Thermoproteota archaeon]
MSMKNGFLSFAGICGILGPIVWIITAALAVSNSPSFSISSNWFSDLAGTMGADNPLWARSVADTPTTAMIFNSGIILVGIIGIIFGVGLWKSILTPSGRIGAFAFIISAIGTIGVGVYPEPAGLPHSLAGIMSFGFAAIGMFYIGASAMETNQKTLGYIITILGLITLTALSTYMVILEFHFQTYFRATSQLIALSAAWIFSIIFGVKIFKGPNPILSKST